MEYEAWKVRELKRVKREREEKESSEKEREDLERMRNMTEEERRMELKNNPKEITNKAAKGKYNYMQKYYHRGAFYMESEVSLHVIYSYLVKKSFVADVVYGNGIIKFNYVYVYFFSGKLVQA